MSRIEAAPPTAGGVVIRRQRAEAIQRGARLAIRVLESAAATIIFLMMILVLVNVTGRYVWGLPVQGTNELIGFVAMPALVFIGYIVAQARGQTIEADIVYQRFPTRIRREVRLGTSLIGALICTGFGWFGLTEAMHANQIGRTAPASDIFIAPIYWLVPAAFAALLVLFVVDAIGAVRGKFDDENFDYEVINDPILDEEIAIDAHVALADVVAPQDRSIEAISDTRSEKGVEVVTIARLYRHRIVISLAVALPTIGVFVAPQRELVGLSAVLLMFVLLLLRIPIAFALAVPGLLGIYSLNGTAAVINLMSSAPFNAASQWALSVLPMFVFMGLLLWQSGITTKMYETARNWLGWLPGGFGVGTNIAGAGLASVSGSTIGTTYALARIGIPEMVKAGYGKSLAIGSVIVAGLPGQLIPPSIFLVVVAGLLENPVGPQLMAGLVPGLLVALMFSTMIIVIAIIRPKWAGRGNGGVKPVLTWRERWRSLANIWPVAVLIGIVLGGMFLGVLTATEAGAAGAAGALIFCVWFQWKNKPLAKVSKSAIETVSSVGAIFFLIAGALILSALVAVSGLGRVFSDLVTGTGMGRVEFLVFLMVIYIILGMFMDPLAILLTTIPILMPVLGSLGIDLLWFGVFAVFMCELAILTPPVGMLSFIIHKILQDPDVNLGRRFSLTDVFKSVGLFLPMAIIVSFVWILFPNIVTWLPSIMR